MSARPERSTWASPSTLLRLVRPVSNATAPVAVSGAPRCHFITRTAWGEVWGDPRIPWKTRSFVTLAMMVALGRRRARSCGW
jgi:alkylhydroperoxidase/carboxymuconolactone decarboxylase family protein YurZ